jgi:DNA-binding transcriptional LysR family regulator
MESHMQFDLVDIRLFMNIAETNSFTGGANRSHICLSAASKRIKNLEDRIGTALFYRNTVGIVPTSAGQVFYNHSLALVQELEHLQSDLQHYSEDQTSESLKGAIRVCASNALVSAFLPSVLYKYSTLYPLVNVEVRAVLSPEILHAVNAGLADIGIYVGNLPSGDAKVLPYGRYNMVLIAACTHPLARQKKKMISFAETLAFEYVTLPESSASRAFLDHNAEIMHKALKVRFQFSTFETLYRMVEANLGIAVVPDFIARRLNKTKTVRVLDLSDDWAMCDMWICMRKGTLARIVKDFVELLIAGGRTTFHTQSVG